jgi:hypothetical protein
MFALASGSDVAVSLSRTDPAGEFVAFYGKNVQAPDLAAQISGHMQRWKPVAA